MPKNKLIDVCELINKTNRALILSNIQAHTDNLNIIYYYLNGGRGLDENWGVESLGNNRVFFWSYGELSEQSQRNYNDLLKGYSKEGHVSTNLGKIKLTDACEILTVEDNSDEIITHFNIQKEMIRSFLTDLSNGLDPEIPNDLGMIEQHHPTLNTRYELSFSHKFNSVRDDKPRYNLLESGILSLFELNQTNHNLFKENRLCNCSKCNSFYFQHNKTMKYCALDINKCSKLESDPDYKKQWNLDQK